jgi:predicted nucleic acid-binding protein
MILVDTSIWIEVFRQGARSHSGEFFDIEEAVTCLPVIQEILQGFRDQSAFRIAREALLSLPVVESPMTLDVFERAVELHRVSRRQGLTVRSSADCLIAACALKHDFTVLHRDRDFPALARVSGLRERRA